MCKDLEVRMSHGTFQRLKYVQNHWIVACNERSWRWGWGGEQGQIPRDLVGNAKSFGLHWKSKGTYWDLSKAVPLWSLYFWMIAVAGLHIGCGMERVSCACWEGVCSNLGERRPIVKQYGIVENAWAWKPSKTWLWHLSSMWPMVTILHSAFYTFSCKME